MSGTASALLAIGATLLVGGLVAWAGSQASVLAFGVPLFALCAAVSFGVNWIVYVPSYLARTERFYDLTGSATYLTLLLCALLFGGPVELRSLLIATLVAIWALRLGTFLFQRISRDGGDGRFDRLKTHPVRFLMAWTLQGLWVFLTLSCALAAMTSTTSRPLGALAFVGAGVWLAGFTLEVVADRQKSAFRADSANRGRFITSGVWAWSRHPNYFGEIVLWIGISLIALPVLAGWQLVTLISPVFVTVLLTRISGIPLLEARGKKKWGDDPAYRAYLERTPVLVPRPPSAA